MAQLKTLLRFVTERESIRLKKAAGQKPPWSSDHILQTYRFCNIRRSDDRVSRWLIANVLKEEYIQENLGNFLLFSAWCRWINWPPTIQKAMDAGFTPASTIDWTKLGKFVDSLDGKKWTGAYMIVAPRGSRKTRKGLFVARTIIEKSLKPGLGQLLNYLRADNASCERVWEDLTIHPYFGGFMSGQVVGDWGYTSLLKDASDRFEWAPVGPGSRRGFNRLMRRPLTTKIDLVEWKSKLLDWRSAIVKELGPVYEDLTALDCQNVLCELDKYLRVKNGEGRPRAKYRTETAYEV